MSFRRSSHWLQSNVWPTTLKASTSGNNSRPRSVSAYSMRGGLPPKSVRSISWSFTISRRRATKVRLLIGKSPECSSIVRLGPSARSRAMSNVHLSPIICSAPETGQPSISRRRKVISVGNANSWFAVRINKSLRVFDIHFRVNSWIVIAVSKRERSTQKNTNPTKSHEADCSRLNRKLTVCVTITSPP